MHRPPGKPLSNLGCTQNRAPVIKHSYKIILIDPSFFRVPGVDPDYPVMPAILFKNAMVLYIIQEAVLFVTHCVKGEPRVRRNKLKRIFLIEFGSMVALPGMLVFWYKGPFLLLVMYFLQA